jgi:hypothetical protein
MNHSCLSSFPIGAVFCAALLLAPAGGLLFAQQNPQPPQAPPPNQALSPDQLDDLVAPVALYPDPLIGQILVAATYPLELVQVSQWLQRNPGLTGADLTQGAQQQNWDPSIQAMVVFPDLVKRLNQDITWTTNLGNAFLAQQADVMDAVQRMRLKAQQAGKLPSTPQERVTTTNQGGQPIIDIEPADPQVIYVPNYDPAYFWGPSLYYPYANWFYPPFIGGNYFGFGFGIGMGPYFGMGWGGWGGWGWSPGWGNHSMFVNNSFIHRNNFNAGRGGSLSGRSTWSHDASHRGGVPYSNRAVSNRYGGAARQNLQARASAGVSQSRGATGASQSRGATGAAQSRGATSQSRGAASQSGGERMGNRQIAPNSSNGNRSAFGGVRDGAAARSHSDHGYSSLGPARSSGSTSRASKSSSSSSGRASSSSSSRASSGSSGGGGGSRASSGGGGGGSRGGGGGRH